MIKFELALKTVGGIFGLKIVGNGDISIRFNGYLFINLYKLNFIYKYILNHVFKKTDNVLYIILGGLKSLPSGII